MRKVAAGELPTRGETLARLFAAWSPEIKTETVPLESAYGRTLAEDVYSKTDKPVVRAARMDGVCVKSAAFERGIPDASGWVRGADWDRADTGDDFPDAYDAVVAIEDVKLLAGGGLEFLPDLEPVFAGTNVADRGSSLAKGDLIGAKGTRLSACDLAALSLGAADRVTVYKKPVVVFVPTGNELVPLGTVPGRGQTVESDSLMARYMLEEMGAEPVIFPIAADTREAIENALSSALEKGDIVILCAGTSKGDEDFCARVIGERGNMLAHGVASAPGKPLGCAVVDGKPVVNVAGPPIACFNGLDWCVRPIVYSFFEQEPPKRHTVPAKLTGTLHGGGEGFEAIVRITLEKTDDGYLAHPYSHKGKATDPLRARALYVTKLIPQPQGIGDTVDVELL